MPTKKNKIYFKEAKRGALTCGKLPVKVLFNFVTFATFL